MAATVPAWCAPHLQSSSPYTRLQLPQSCSAKEVEKRFRKLALTMHPDRNPGLSAEERKVLEHAFSQITEAAELLQNEEARAQWDRANASGQGVPVARSGAAHASGTVAGASNTSTSAAATAEQSQADAHAREMARMQNVREANRKQMDENFRKLEEKAKFEEEQRRQAEAARIKAEQEQQARMEREAALRKEAAQAQAAAAAAAAAAAMYPPPWSASAYGQQYWGGPAPPRALGAPAPSYGAGSYERADWPHSQQHYERPPSAYHAAGYGHGAPQYSQASWQPEPPQQASHWRAQQDYGYGYQPAATFGIGTFQSRPMSSAGSRNTSYGAQGQQSHAATSSAHAQPQHQRAAQQPAVVSGGAGSQSRSSASSHAPASASISAASAESAVRAFFASIDYSEYASSAIELGLDTMQRLAQAHADDIKQLKRDDKTSIKPLHADKIARALQRVHAV